MMTSSLLLPSSSLDFRPKLRSFSSLRFLVSSKHHVLMHNQQFSLQAARKVCSALSRSVTPQNAMLSFLEERGFSETELERFMTCSNETWKLKLKSFEDLGFSEDDVAKMLRRSLQVFRQSEEKIHKVKEVLLETGKYDLSSIVKYPAVLSYSVEERLKPRLEVLKALEMRNLIDKWPRLSALSHLPDKKFFQKFVEPYIDHLANTVIAKNAVRLQN